MNTKGIINKVIKSYLLESNTEYAILINGDWGSGKTYYWKNELSVIAKNNQFKSIYISLNGISSTKLIEQELFYKILPFINKSDSKKINNFFKILNNSANIFSRFILKSEITDVFKGVNIDLFNFKNYIVCFDDLERCQMPVQKTLGFINKFIEHKNLKTIILADEKKLKNKTRYNIIKEKTIGRTLNFELSITESISFLIERFKSKIDFYKFLIKEQQYIVDIFTEYKQNNLRITLFYFIILENLFFNIKDINSKFKKEIILFSAIISIEFKLGNLKSTEYNNPKELDTLSTAFPFLYEINKQDNNANNKNINKKYHEFFYETYLTERIEEYNFYLSIYSYILSGYLDTKKLNGELKDREMSLISDEQNCFNKVINYDFRTLSNTEFRTSLNKVIKYATEGKYPFYNYIQITKFLYFFSKQGLINMTTQEIERFLDKGINIAKVNSEINNHRIEQINFWECDPNLENIKKKILDINNERKQQLESEKINKIIEILQSNEETRLQSFFRELEFTSHFFKHINPQLLTKYLLEVSNQTLHNFTKLIRKKYDVKGIRSFISGDYQNLNKTKEMLKHELKKVHYQPQKFLLKELIEELEEAGNKLQETTK